MEDWTLTLLWTNLIYFCIPIQEWQSKCKQFCLCPYSQLEPQKCAFRGCEYFDRDLILILGIHLENFQQWERLHLVKPHGSWPWQQLSATGGKEQDWWQQYWAWDWGSIRLTREEQRSGFPWQSTGEWKIHNRTRRSLRSMIAWCFIFEQTASLEWSAWRENKQTKTKANFGFKYWVMLWKKCCASDDKGEEKERKEIQKAEQMIKKKSCSTENDEVKSQSKFQIRICWVGKGHSALYGKLSVCKEASR